MTHGSLLVLLLGIPLSACGYTAHYDGTMIDATGAPQRGLTVTLDDLFVTGPRYRLNATAADTVARATHVETAVTDENGHFELAHDMGGRFGCGLGVDDAPPPIVIAPAGERGAVTVVWPADNHTHQLRLGTIALASTALPNARIEGDRLRVDVPAGDDWFVRVDGEAWRPDADGTVPVAALQGCAEGQACDHIVALATHRGRVDLRSAIEVLHAAAPNPYSLTELAPGLHEIELTQEVALSQIVVDGLFDEAPMDTIDVATLVGKLFYLGRGAHQLSPLPISSCHVYGTGLRCNAPFADVAAVAFDFDVPSHVRLFMRDGADARMETASAP